MKIIDAYCGTGPWMYRDKIQPSDPAETLEIMDHCGIDSALAFSNLAAHTMNESVDSNACTAEIARQYPRFIPAFVITNRPYDDSRKVEDYLPEMRACNARGAWLCPQNNRQVTGMWTWTTDPIFEFCSSYRIPLFLSIEATDPNRVNEICRDFPDLILVLTNLAYNSDNWLYPLLRRHALLHVCCGPTYIPPLGPQRFVRHFGSYRLIFGSGLPHFGPGGLIGHVMYAEIPDTDKAQILGGNIERLMAEVQL